jgi:hypothetical protein
MRAIRVNQASDLRKRVTTVDNVLTCGFLGAMIGPDIHVLLASLPLGSGNPR